MCSHFSLFIQYPPLLPFMNSAPSCRDFCAIFHAFLTRIQETFSLNRGHSRMANALPPIHHPFLELTPIISARVRIHFGRTRNAFCLLLNAVILSKFALRARVLPFSNIMLEHEPNRFLGNIFDSRSGIVAVPLSSFNCIAFAPQVGMMRG